MCEVNTFIDNSYKTFCSDSQRLW